MKYLMVKGRWYSIPMQETKRSKNYTNIKVIYADASKILFLKLGTNAQGKTSTSSIVGSDAQLSANLVKPYKNAKQHTKYVKGKAVASQLHVSRI